MAVAETTLEIDLRYAVALYAYTPTADNELALSEGQLLFIPVGNEEYMHDTLPDWILVCVADDAQQGYVPRSYIELVSEEEYYTLKYEASATLSQRSSQERVERLQRAQSVQRSASAFAGIDRADEEMAALTARIQQRPASQIGLSLPSINKLDALQTKSLVYTASNDAIIKAIEPRFPNHEADVSDTPTPTDKGYRHKLDQYQQREEEEVDQAEEEVDQAEEDDEEEDDEDEEDNEQKAETIEKEKEEAYDSADARSEMRRSNEFSRKALLAYQRKHARRVTGSIFIRSSQTEEFSGMPPGFRSSALSALLADGNHLTSSYINPHLITHGLAYRDIYKDRNTGCYTTKPSLQTICFSLLRIDGMPAPHPTISVQSRSLRFALYNKKSNQIIGNIHTIAAYVQKEGDRTWRFSSKTSIINRRDEENTCFAKFDLNPVEVATNELNLLFEPVISLIKYHETDRITETADIACGWTGMPLYNVKQQPLDNKTYEIKLLGGTPWEVSEEESLTTINGSDAKGLWRNILSGDSVPKLFVQVRKVKQKLLSELNNLPTPLVTSLSCLPILSLYRLTLLDCISDQHHYSPDKLPAPLGVIAQVCNDQNWMYLLAEYWRTAWKSMKQSERRHLDLVKDKFTETVWSFWPMLHVVEPFSNERDVILTNWNRKSIKSKNLPGSQYTTTQLTPAQHFKRDGALISLGKNPGNMMFSPFDIRELSLVV